MTDAEHHRLRERDPLLSVVIGGVIVSVVFSFAAVGISAWQLVFPPSTLKVQALEIVSPTGRIHIGSDSGRPELAMYDSLGNLRLDLAVLKSGDPTLTIYDGAGWERLDLGVLSTQGFGLNIFGPASRASLELTTTRDGRPALFFDDGDGKRRLGLGILQSGTPAIELRDDHQKLRGVFGGSDFGIAGNRTELSVMLIGSDGKIIWSRP